MKHIVLTAALTYALALPVVAGSQAPKPAPPPPAPVPAAPHTGGHASFAAADRAFVLEAAHGGMAEVELGRLAADKASNADVKQFGQRMVDDHGKANDELKALASQKNVTLPTELDAKHKATVARLSKLSGEAFDRAYMTDMVADHNKDVATFTRQSKMAKDADLKAWAAKTLPTLQEHQKMAREISAKVRGTAGTTGTVPKKTTR
jgi:putative membrane protein